MEQPNKQEEEMSQKPKSGRGGARVGGGRKKTTAKRYGIRAPADVVAIIEAQEQKTDFICDAVRYYHAYLMKKK